MKKRKRYKGTFSWNEPKRAEGGRGHDLKDRANFRGVKARPYPSCYVGHVGVTFYINNKAEAKTVAEQVGEDG